MLEIIATCIDDVHAITAGGGDRIELVTGLSEGGLTPSTALVRRAVQESRLPVSVMIRPHALSFVYSSNDISLMREDILNARRLGASGVVLGCLDEQGQIDEKVLSRLLDMAGPMSVTFHRAFDRVPDAMAALKVLKQYPQITRILTAGGPGKAVDNLDSLKRLAEAAAPDIVIMPGGGVTADGIPTLLHVPGISEVHVGTAVRFGLSSLQLIDPEALRHCVNVTHKAIKEQKKGRAAQESRA